MSLACAALVTNNTFSALSVSNSFSKLSRWATQLLSLSISSWNWAIVTSRLSSTAFSICSSALSLVFSSSVLRRWACPTSVRQIKTSQKDNSLFVVFNFFFLLSLCRGPSRLSHSSAGFPWCLARLLASSDGRAGYKSLRSVCQVFIATFKRGVIWFLFIITGGKKSKQQQTGKHRLPVQLCLFLQASLSDAQQVLLKLADSIRRLRQPPPHLLPFLRQTLRGAQELLGNKKGNAERSRLWIRRRDPAGWTLSHATPATEWRVVRYLAAFHSDDVIFCYCVTAEQ